MTHDDDDSSREIKIGAHLVTSADFLEGVCASNFLLMAAPHFLDPETGESEGLVSKTGEQALCFMVSNFPKHRMRELAEALLKWADDPESHSLGVDQDWVKILKSHMACGETPANKNLKH